MPQTPGQPVYSKPSEADACRKYVTPGLVAAGWETEPPHSLAEQRTFTDGRIIGAGHPPPFLSVLPLVAMTVKSVCRRV